MTGGRFARAVASAVVLLAASGCLPEKPKQPAGPPAGSHKLVFEALTTPAGARVTVLVDGIDQFGGHGVNADNGRPYPWEGIRRTPYRHTVFYEPGITVTARFEVIYRGGVGEVAGCKVYDNGREIGAAKAAASIKTKGGQARALCLYTTSGRPPAR